MDVVEETVIEYLRKNVGGNPRLSDQLSLVGVDSVGMAELTFELEKRFSIRIGDDVLDLQTIGELVDYIRERTNANAS
jgi:acyl carrier protein